MKHIVRLMVLAGLMMVVTSCGDPASGSGKSAVFLVASGGQKWGIIADVYNAAAPGKATNNYFDITIKSERKDPTKIPLSVYSDVILEEYRIDYFRSDGNPKVPEPLVVPMNSRVPVDGEAKLNLLVLTRDAKLKSPLKELAFGGGEGSIIMAAVITFYGKDLAGNSLTVTYQLHIEAGDYAADV